ncbi:MAG: hypothetical protein HZB64_03900 [Rhodocyclales bacterium]|nr:hypothetical protein [Rhodocyclales bacterium]
MLLEKHLRDRIALEDRMALIEVCHLINKAQQAWNRIESGKQCELNAMHYEESSLAHCLWWGTQAAEDLIELTKGTGKPTKT